MFDLFGQLFVGVFSVISAIWKLFFGSFHFIFQVGADATGWLAGIDDGAEQQ
jgi:hypothetical protein